MPAIEYTILETRQVLDPAMSRAGQPAYLIIYRTGPGTPPRSVFLPKPAPTEQEIKSAVEADIKANHSLTGRSFTANIP